MIKKLFTFLCLCTLCIGSAWGEDVTYKFTPNSSTTGITSTSYITAGHEFTCNEIKWFFNQWNASSLQIKTNQANANNEFNFKNTSAFPGRIKSVVITFSALTVSNANGLCFVGGTSAISSLSGGTAGTWNSTAKTLTWTPASTANYTYFAFYQNGKVATGTNNLAVKDAIVITYEEGDTPVDPVAPSITTQPKGASYEKDATATALTIAASGTPTPTYQWYSNTTESTSGASLISGATNTSYTPSTATIGTKYYYCVATNTEGSATSDIVAVTVTAALPKITITKTSSGITTSYSSSTFTQNEVTFAYTDWMSSTDFIQAKASTSPSLQNTTAMPGKITKIQVVTGSGKTARAVTIKAGTTSTVDDMVSITSPTTSMDMVFDFGETNYTYFCLSTPGNACYFDKIVISYEEDKTPTIKSEIEEIEFEQKELSGTVTDSKVISATGKNLTAAISASMKEGSDAVFSVTPVGTPTAAAGEFTVSYSTTEAGEYAGTVVLSSGETSIEIPVSASVVAHIPVLQSIYVKGEPTKKEYTVGDAFETAGLEVWGKYDEGDDQQITEGIEWTVTPATFSATTETSVSVVANALEKTSEAFAVTGLTINEAPKVVTYDFTSNLYGHTGVSSGSDNHDGDIAVDEIFTESPTQIKFIKSGSTVTRFWSNKGTSELRTYKNAEFTISSTDYNITKVEFSGTVNLKVGETAVSDKTWTGKQKSVTFVNTDNNSALTGITVHYATAAPSAETPTITPSVEAETYWDPITVTLASSTEDAAIYYTTNGDEPTASSTLYENPINVNTTTTIKAIAVKDGLDNSEVVTKTFNFGPIFNSLEDLAAADITTGTVVKVTFENVPIKSVFVTQKGYRNGIYFDIQKGGNDIEIFYNDVPESWVAGGTVSGTMTCPWKYYNDGDVWELAPEKDSWNWSNLTYNAPIATMSITSAKWGTFCAPFDVELEEGVSAYIAYVDEEGNVTFEDATVDGFVIAGTPVIVYKDVTETYTKVYSAAVEDFEETCTEGALVGVYAATSGIPAIEDGNQNYVLQNHEGKVGFYKANNNISLNANRCYMSIKSQNAKESFLFDEITGINAILYNKDKSVEGIFDLNGRRLPAPRKGVNIINGVKVIVK